MKIAFDEAMKNPLSSPICRTGGPFGAVIVGADGEFFVTRNEVKKEQDPTAHAEIVAIRKVAKEKGMGYLKKCVLYCTCYPCPMCLGAIKWAGIPKVYYGSKPTDARDSEFELNDLDDVPSYALIMREANKFGITSEEIPSICIEELDRDECIKLFTAWVKREKKT